MSYFKSKNKYQIKYGKIGYSQWIRNSLVANIRSTVNKHRNCPQWNNWENIIWIESIWAKLLVRMSTQNTFAAFSTTTFTLAKRLTLLQIHAHSFSPIHSTASMGWYEHCPSHCRIRKWERAVYSVSLSLPASLYFTQLQTKTIHCERLYNTRKLKEQNHARHAMETMEGRL